MHFYRNDSCLVKYHKQSIDVLVLPTKIKLIIRKKYFSSSIIPMGRIRKPAQNLGISRKILYKKRSVLLGNIKRTAQFPEQASSRRRPCTAGKPPGRITFRTGSDIRRQENAPFVYVVFIISGFRFFIFHILLVLFKKFTFLRIPSIDQTVTICYHNITTQSKQGTFRKGGNI